MKRTTVMLAGLLLAGCGPLSRPMVMRLDEDQQRRIDEAWANMLDPPARLDRTLLLDVMLTGRMHEMGVDRLEFTSEKDVGDSVVKMEVHFDRRQPQHDRFIWTLMDREGEILRREQFSREEVEERVDFLYGPTAEACDEQEREVPLQECQKELRARRDARKEQIAAATQPAGHVD